MVWKTPFCTASLCVFLLYPTSDGSAADIVLPQGSAPAPIVARHFPDRVHTFVWRNWNAVEPAKLAKDIGHLSGEHQRNGGIDGAAACRRDSS